MKRILVLTFVLMLTGWITSCEDQQDPTPDLKPSEISVTAEAQQLIRSGNHFGIELFKQINANQEVDTNTLVSPVSVSLALAMTYNGAAGDTKTAMEQTLHLENLSKAQINESYRTLMKALLSVDPKVTMELANSIWYEAQFSVEEDFIDVNREYYDAQVASLDFAAPGAVDIINQWCSDKTHGKIEEMIDFVPPAAVMYLINALYFNGTWKYEFDRSLTGSQPFYQENGQEIAADMMHLEGDLNYLSNELFQAIELPYGRGNYSMVCLLPYDDMAVDELIGQITADRWDQWMGDFTRQGCNLALPKFKFGFSDSLNAMLSNMGMGIAFDPLRADFSGINPLSQLFINRVLHKTFIEVDEKGTEAAAVTVVEMRENSSSSGSPIPITFDRPFVFAIREVTTGTIVFVGKLVKPGIG